MKKVYYFDPVDAGFYVSTDSPIIPDSATEISFDIYSKFAGLAWPEGKMLGADADKNPAWVDASPPTHEEDVASAEARKRTLINQANEYINTKQWPGKAAIGRLKDDELTQYNEWLDYLDALEAIDTASTTDINWPNPPA